MNRPSPPNAVRKNAPQYVTNNQQHPQQQPIANAAEGLARKLAQPNSTELFLSAIELMTHNYLPHPALLTMLHDHLPFESNALAQLTSAKTIDELLACRHDLEQFLGRNQGWKTPLLQVNTEIYHSAPTTLIKSFLNVINNTQVPLTWLPLAQQEQIIEFVIFLTDFAESNAAPRQFVKELTPREAHTFLYCLSWNFYLRPISQVIKDFRHELAVYLIDVDSRNLDHLPTDLMDNAAFIEQAIIFCGLRGFNTASARLQNNPHIQKLLGYRMGENTLSQPAAPEDVDCALMAMAAGLFDEAELLHISTRLLNDREFVLAMAADEPFILGICSQEFVEDREFMLTAIKQNPWALEYAKDEINDDPVVVIDAVQRNRRVLQFASDRLQAYLTEFLPTGWHNNY